MKALLIGGTGTISMAITKRLAALPQWEVYLLNRGNRQTELPANVQVLQADINDAAAVRALLEPHHFDTVADFIAFTPNDVRRDLDLFSAKTDQYIFISTASAYHKPVRDFPITESTPLKNPFWDYSRQKIACEDILTENFRHNDFPVTIVRPSHTYDNRNLPLAVRGEQRAWQTVLRLREGKKVIVHGDGSSLWTLTHADDFAVGFTGLMANPLAIGHAVNIVSDDVLTWNMIYDCIGRALGVKPDILYIPSEEIARVSPDRAGTLLGDKAHSVFFDNAKLRRLVPEFATTRRFASAVHDIVAAMNAQPSLQIPDPDFDAWCDDMCRRYAHS